MKKLWRYWARALGEKVGENNISLPLSPAMRKYDAKTVVEALKKIFYE